MDGRPSADFLCPPASDGDSPHFLNLNYFASDTEKVITSTFSGNLDALFSISQKLGGTPDGTELPYDLTMRFDMLPRISLLLLFNEKDENFPCHGTVLFQKHSEHYLDPESLTMTGACLASRLKKCSKANHESWAPSKGLMCLMDISDNTILSVDGLAVDFPHSSKVFFDLPFLPDSEKHCLIADEREIHGIRAGNKSPA